MKELAHIRMEQGGVYLDGRKVFQGDSSEFRVFARELYRALELDYGKFFKMSPLSKLGFLASEYLLREVDTSSWDLSRVALVLANRSSSLHTDNIYQESVAHKPSPAIFVYTLPNIVIGEICIRHGFMGEGVFYIQEEYDSALLREHAVFLLETGEATHCIHGWVEMDIQGSYLADLVLLANEI